MSACLHSDLSDVTQKLDSLHAALNTIFTNLRALYTFIQVQFGPWNVEANERILEGMQMTLNGVSALNIGQLELRHCWDSAVGAFGKIESRLQRLEDRLLQQEREMVKNVTLTYDILENNETMEKIKTNTEIIKQSAKLTNHVEQQRDLILLKRFEDIETKMDRLSLKIQGLQSLTAFADMKVGATNTMIEEAVPLLKFLCDERIKIKEHKKAKDAEKEEARIKKETRRKEMEEEKKNTRNRKRKKTRREKNDQRREKERNGI